MDIDRAYNKLIKKTYKNSVRLLNNMTFKGYLDISSNFICMENSDKPYYSLYIMSDLKLKRHSRRMIIDTLDNLEYKRGKEDKWTEPAVIYFIDAVMRLYLNKNLKEETIEKREISISNKFNVPVNRLKTQVALFINNLDKGKDKFNIDYYFNALELISWKYRDIDKLYQLVEENKLLPGEEDIIKSIYNI